MNRTAHRLITPFLAPFLLFAPGIAEVPRLPFSGAHGGTMGAGSITGWDRHGGDNPAVLGAPGYGASLAGYSPFGLEALRVVELEAARDGARWGGSLGWRALFDDAGSAMSAYRAQGAWKPRPGLSAGGSLQVLLPGGNPGIGAGLGILWRPHAAVSFGAAWENRPSPLLPGREHRAGLGADAGSKFGAGYAWRLCAERFFASGGDAESRYGLGFRFHALLSVYAGFAPRREAAALGVRFGMGGWEGFSALRRHAALGGTSIQGLQWRRETE